MKILLLDTSFAAAPIYYNLIKKGHTVWVMGNRSSDYLAKIAPSYWVEQNYSDTEAVLTVAENLGIERIVPGCTDVSIETCLQLPYGERLHDSFSTNQALTHKRQFRSICKHLALPSPEVLDAGVFPKSGRYICKPVDAYSGKGISIFDGSDTQALNAALADARRSSRTGEALIETYIDGDLYSCSGFIENGLFTDVFFVKEGSSVNNYAVDTSFVIHDFQNEKIEYLKNSLERLAQHLALKDGLLHTQFILSDHDIAIIEITRRCPGDLYSMLIEYSTGFQYAGKYASYFCGDSFETSYSNARHILRHTVSSDNITQYGGITFPTPTPVVAFYPLTLMGDTLLERQQTRAGLLFTEYTTADKLENAYRAFLSRNVYHVASLFGC
ncbi:ATP-grasp domain-containing protein [Acetobacter syzygii]|uniref:ATP-grasp domain-containing protein n=1 Tax=Acetobacter syzygii TaxID=146476 RepID=UPI0039EA304B